MSATARFTLRDLPAAPRAVVAVFLVAVAAGYAAALVQLHYQHASPGNLLPGTADVKRAYGGRPEVSTIERLLETNGGPFGGAGTMRPAFTVRSRDWEELTRGLSPEALQQLTARREAERLALLDWVRGGADRDAYERDDHPLGAGLAALDLAPELLVVDARTGQPASPRRARIRTLIQQRCVDCHGTDGRYEAARAAPLDSYEALRPYCQAGRKGTSVEKLAQTTHAHLFGFAVLYGLTGLIFSYSSYSAGVRLTFAPLALAAQVAEVGCWWLTRLEPAFAGAVVGTAALATVGLAVQVVGSLWDLSGKAASGQGPGPAQREGP
jgi:hypothetical protein